MKGLLHKHPIALSVCTLFLIIIVCFMVIIGIDRLVDSSVQGRLYSQTKDIPFNKVGLLLGTAKWLSRGQINPYYQYRLDAAIDLYDAGKVEYILVSGDNATSSYNEPITIQKDLIRRGIADNKIYLDFAGFRTLDSVIRSKHIFGQHSITIISQQFHNERALYIADQSGIEAVGYNAQDVSQRSQQILMDAREMLARVRMGFDVLWGTEPKFLGEPVIIQ